MNLSSSISSALRLSLLTGVLLLGTLSASEARADSIGINFSGASGLAAGTSAGVVAQTNWNNVTGISGTSGALNNNTGAATTTTLTYAATSGGNLISNPVGGDEQLNSRVISNQVNIPITFTLDNISYAGYDIYVYNIVQNGVRQQTTLGSTSYFGTSPDPFSAGYLDGNAATPYIYTQATSTTAGTFTLGANYVRFSGLTGATQSFSVTGLNAASRVGGIQVVATPEPSTYAMMFLGVGALGLMTWKRKRSANSDADFVAEAI